MHTLVTIEDKPYTELFNILHGVDFCYIASMDCNMEEHGMELRYRFGTDENIDHREICYYLDRDGCSFLEMMVALAFRCEEDIMDDPEFGNRTSIWFSDMLTNLGIADYDDLYFKENSPDIDSIQEDILSKIEICLNRDYEKNGSGGLFITKNQNIDMRYLDIWQQLNRYLLENYI